MKKAINQLIEFHQSLGESHPQRPTSDIPNSIKTIRKNLLQEELQELINAIDDEPIENIAKELADVLYVTLGTAVAFGLQSHLTQVFETVHQNNMSKITSPDKTVLSCTGKVLKPKHYQQPNIKNILES